MRIATWLIIMLIVTGPAWGMDLARRALDYGVREIGISGAYLHVADSENHSFEMNLRGGRMLGGGMELELETGWQRSWREDYSNSSITAALNFAYNIRTYRSWMPFFLGGGGLVHGRYSNGGDSDSETDGMINFGAGTKLFFTPDAALRVEYRYRTQLADPENIDSHNVLFGISAFLR